MMIKRLAFCFCLLQPVAQGAEPLPEGARLRIGTTRFWHRQGAKAVAWSPNGKWVVTGGLDNVALWDAKTGALIRRVYQGGAYTLLAFSPNSRILAVGQAEKGAAISLLSVPDGKEIQAIQPGPGVARALVISGDSRHLIVNYRTAVQIWDIQKKSQKRPLEGHSEKVRFLSISKNGNVLVSADEKQIFVWSLKDRALTRQWKTPSERMLCLALSPDGRYLATGDTHGKLHIWNPATGKLVHHLSHSTPTLALAFSPNGQQLVSIEDVSTTRKVPGRDQWQEVFHHRPTMHLWKVESGKRIRSFGARSGQHRHMCFSPDGQKILTSGDKAEIWSIETGKQLFPWSGHRDDVISLDVSKNGKLIASRSLDGTVRVWDARSGKQRCLAHIKGDRGYIEPVSIHPSGKKLLWSNENRFHIGNLQTGRQWLPIAHRSRFRYPQYSPNGNHLIAVDAERKNLHLWHIDPWKPLRKWASPHVPIEAIDISNDGRLLATAHYDRIAHVFALPSGKRIQSFQGHQHWLSGIELSPDSKTLVTSSSDNTVRLWDVKTGKARHVLRDHKGQVLSVAYSPQGTMVAAGGNGKDYLQVWEVLTGQLRCALPGHLCSVEALTFSADGRELISGSEDTTILFWDLYGLSKKSDKPLSQAQLRKLWDQLAHGNASVAFEAIRQMARHPRQALPLLKKHLHPAPHYPEKDLEKLITDLEHRRFAIRERAAKKLFQLEQAAEPALRAMLKKELSLDLRKQIKRLLSELDPWGTSAARLRLSRAMEVLSVLPLPEAQHHLRAMAQGAPGSHLTRLAKQALKLHCE